MTLAKTTRLLNIFDFLRNRSDGRNAFEVSESSPLLLILFFEWFQVNLLINYFQLFWLTCEWKCIVFGIIHTDWRSRANVSIRNSSLNLSWNKVSTSFNKTTIMILNFFVKIKRYLWNISWNIISINNRTETGFENEFYWMPDIFPSIGRSFFYLSGGQISATFKSGTSSHRHEFICQIHTFLHWKNKC